MKKHIYYKAVVKFKDGNSVLCYNLLVLVGDKNNILKYELREGWTNKKIYRTLVSTETVLPVYFHDIQDILKKDEIECCHNSRKDFFDKIFSEKFDIIESKYYY